MASWQKVETKTTKNKGGKKSQGGSKTQSSLTDGIVKPIQLNSRYEEAREYLTAYQQHQESVGYDAVKPETLSADMSSQSGLRKKQNNVAVSKKNGQGSKKSAVPAIPVVQSFAVPNLRDLDLAAVESEIQGLASVDKEKRCLNLAVFLNMQRPHTEVKGWETASFESCEPLQSMPRDVARLVGEFVHNMPPATTARNFDLCLAELLSKNANNATIWAFKLMIQLLAKHHGETAILKNNKSLSGFLSNAISAGGPQRAQAISWACLQPLHWDARLSVQIWCRVMLPCIGNKSVAPIVTSALSQLLSRDEITKSSDLLNNIDFFHLLDYTFPAVHNLLDARTKAVLLSAYPTLRNMAFTRKISTNAQNFFLSFLTRFKATQSVEMRNELLHCIAMCLKTNPNICYEQWLKALSSHLVQTVSVFEKLECNWDSLSVEVPTKQLNNFISKVITFTKGAQFDDDYAREKLLNVTSLLKDRISRKRVTPSSGKKSTFSFLFFFIISLAMIVLIAGAVDLALHDGKPTHSLLVYNTVTGQLNRGHKWVAVNFPHELAAFNKFTRPYLQAINAYLLRVYRYLEKNIPALFDFIYKDLPISLYNKFRVNYLPSLSKWYKLQLEPVLFKASEYVGYAVEWTAARVNVESIFVYFV